MKVTKYTCAKCGEERENYGLKRLTDDTCLSCAGKEFLRSVAEAEKTVAEQNGRIASLARRVEALEQRLTGFGNEPTDTNLAAIAVIECAVVEEL